MLAARLPDTLPPLEPTEALELGMIQSVVGGLFRDNQDENLYCLTGECARGGSPAAAWRAWIMNEQPTTAVPSTHLGVRPR